MLWLARPSYLRWAAATLLVMAAAALDLIGRATEPYPFVTATVSSGAAVTDEDVEWRDVPVGLLPPPASLGAPAATELTPGEPLTSAMVSVGRTVPTGWWSVPVDLPEDVATGTPVKLVAVDPPLDTEGVVARPSTSGAFALAGPGLVAVPPDTAGVVARAVATGALVVLLGT